MQLSLTQSFLKNFLGSAPSWYKLIMIGFLLLNPIALYTVGPFITGWLLIAQFIFTLAMALHCYPLQSGGLLALEAVLLGLTTPGAVYKEALHNFQVILLLIFMVAGIYFMKDLLMLSFTKILLKVRKKITLSLLFVLLSAFLSAFLDALTVIAVIISVGVGFYSIYYKIASNGRHAEDSEHTLDPDEHVLSEHREDLKNFRGFLRNLMMHAGVGTALGGVCTLVGEPQNLLIAQQAGWTFKEFFLRMAPITLPVLVFGTMTTVMLEKFRIFSYGFALPANVRTILEEFDAKQALSFTNKTRAKIIFQAIIAVWLIIGLAFHLAEVGMIGLSVIVLLTAFNGIIEEHQMGKAFTEALPFTALLVVFFAIVAMIHDQGLFNPILDAVFQMDKDAQITMFYLANGILSMISDNVFVASVYINEAHKALNLGVINALEFDLIAVAINTGTNIPSVATPNGQAAFLFLLTSAIAPLIRLSYGRMVWMALPYFIVMTLVGLLCTIYLLKPYTLYMLELGWLN